MTLLFGSTGYIGSAFKAELNRRQIPFECISHSMVEYTHPNVLRILLRAKNPDFVINAAGYTGKPNVDACEANKMDTLLGNAIFPYTLAIACSVMGIPWGHVSSGCIYNGPGPYAEDDEPNFSFRKGNPSYYSGTKALGEELIRDLGQNYIWRLRIPFDEFDGPRNYLSKLQRYARVYENVNSISHRGDFVNVCLDMIGARVPFGTYNITNPGAVATTEVVNLIKDILKIDRPFLFWDNDEQFYRMAAMTPRSNCVLSVDKLLATGLKMRPATEAIEHALKNWKPESCT